MEDTVPKGVSGPTYAGDMTSTLTTPSLVVPRTGNSSVLTVEDVQRPQPKAGEVLVKVYAASVNALDWKLRAGYQPGDALMLALRKDVDLHIAADLLARGCPERTALLILI